MNPNAPSHASNGGPMARAFGADRSVLQHPIPRAALRRALSLARPYRSRLILFLAVIALEAAAGAASPLLVQRLIDDGIRDGRSELVLALAGAMALLAIAQAALSLADRWISADVGERLVQDLRVTVFDHVQRMPLAFFSRSRTGALVQRLNGDVLGAQQAFTGTLQAVVSNTLTVVFILAAMFAMSWPLTLMALVLVPVFVLPARWFGTRIATATRESFALNADAAQTMTERFSVSGAYLVKVFGDPDRERAAYAGQVGQMREVGVRRALYSVWFRVGLTTVAAVGTAAVYGFGGVLAVNGTLTVGVVIALTAYLARLYGPLTGLSNVQVDVMTALVSFERVFEILDLRPSVVDRPGARDLREAVADLGASVELDAVAFRYPDEDEASLGSLSSRPGGADLERPTRRAGNQTTLTGVGFTIPAGRTVALVGPSGAGKTTLSHLVTRMYDPSAGAVRIAGQDLRDVTLDSLRATVGVVGQDAHLLHDTIAANLRYVRPGATDEMLWAALTQAHVADLVESLPEGLETVVGERGYRLSGGERQRLAIARLLLRAPAVVVLDEATAHLDSESEAAVQAALDTALSGRTALVIAHRLSTVRRADAIVVLDRGRVVEHGTHEELLATGGLYSQLYRTQYAQTTPTTAG